MYASLHQSAAMAYEVQDASEGEETEAFITEVLPGKFNENVGGGRTVELRVEVGEECWISDNAVTGHVIPSKTHMFNYRQVSKFLLTACGKNIPVEDRCDLGITFRSNGRDVPLLLRDEGHALQLHYHLLSLR